MGHHVGYPAVGRSSGHLTPHPSALSRKRVLRSYTCSIELGSKNFSKKFKKKGLTNRSNYYIVVIIAENKKRYQNR